MKEVTNKGHNIFIYLSVFLITFSLFCYEILLTRLFSVILSHNLVFLVVSFAILGSGLGGIYTYKQLRKGEFRYKNNDFATIGVAIPTTKMSNYTFINIFPNKL